MLLSVVTGPYGCRDNFLTPGEQSDLLICQLFI